MTKDKTENKENQPKSEEAENQTDLGFLDSVISDIPDAQPHVIEREKEKQREIESITDADGVKFDPSLHVNKDGKPSLTKTGKFRKKKGVVDPTIKQKQEEQKAEENADSKASAELVQSLKRGIYKGVFDFEYSNERHITHVVATTEYFISEGGVKLTPLQNLLILEGFMGLELLRTEKGAKKVTGIKAWIASKYVKFKDRKKAKKNDTHTDNRTDTKRENDASGEID